MKNLKKLILVTLLSGMVGTVLNGMLSISFGQSLTINEDFSGRANGRHSRGIPSREDRVRKSIDKSSRRFVIKKRELARMELLDRRERLAKKRDLARQRELDGYQIRTNRRLREPERSLREKLLFLERDNLGCPAKSKFPLQKFDRLYRGFYPKKFIFDVVKSLIGFVQEHKSGLFVLKKSENNIFVLQTSERMSSGIFEDVVEGIAFRGGDCRGIFEKFREEHLGGICEFYRKRHSNNVCLKERIVPSHKTIKDWVKKYVCSLEGQVFLKELYESTWSESTD